MIPLQKAEIETNSLSGGRVPSPDKIVQRKLTFDLPFVIMVEDNFGNGLIQGYYRGMRNFNRTSIEIAKETTFDFTPAHNHSNQTPLDCPAPYVVDSKYGPIRLTFLKVNSHADEYEYLSNSNADFLNKEFMGSTSKALGFTCVMVELDESTYSIDVYNGNSKNLNDLVEEVMKSFNFFLQQYKLASNRLYIPSVTPQSIGRFTLITMTEDGAISLASTIRHWETPVPFEKVISKDIDKYIRKACIERVAPALFDILQYEAWNKITLHEWRIAIVNSVILFESYLTPALQDVYRDKGLTDGQIRDKFKTDEPKKKDRKHLGITEISEKLILDAIKLDFKKTKQYDDLLNKAIIMRNSIIHKSKYDVTQADAYACIHAVMNAIELISNAIVNYEIANPTPGIKVYTEQKFDAKPR
jgi:hypothetical protein